MEPNCRDFEDSVFVCGQWHEQHMSPITRLKIAIGVANNFSKNNQKKKVAAANTDTARLACVCTVGCVFHWKVHWYQSNTLDSLCSDAFAKASKWARPTRQPTPINVCIVCTAQPFQFFRFRFMQSHTTNAIIIYYYCKCVFLRFVFKVLTSNKTNPITIHKNAIAVSREKK